MPTFLQNSELSKHPPELWKEVFVNTRRPQFYHQTSMTALGEQKYENNAHKARSRFPPAFTRMISPGSFRKRIRRPYSIYKGSNKVEAHSSEKLHHSSLSIFVRNIKHERYEIPFYYHPDRRESPQFTSKIEFELVNFIESRTSILGRIARTPHRS